LLTWKPSNARNENCALLVILLGALWQRWQLSIWCREIIQSSMYIRLVSHVLETMSGSSLFSRTSDRIIESWITWIQYHGYHRTASCHTDMQDQRYSIMRRSCSPIISVSMVKAMRAAISSASEVASFMGVIIVLTWA